MPTYPSPVIVLPGIMGSALRDEYPVSPENVWSVLKAAVKNYERITLHPDDPRFEVMEPARVVKDEVFGLFYGELIEELRYNLSPAPDRQVPVFPFAYDWRQPLAEIQKQLAAFVDEVIARTSLMRHYHAAGYTKDTGKVNLVAHSMGGLVVAGYVADHGIDKVDRVATLASPFRGSIEAVAKTTLGVGGFGSTSGGSREREAARLTPALYHLLPSYNGAVRRDSFKSDIYLPGSWQPGILDTLATFVQRHGLDPANAGRQARALLTAMLDTAWKHRTALEKLRLPDSKAWLCVVGVNCETRLDIRIARGSDGSPSFEMGDMLNRWKASAPNPATGDTTVPYAGARCAFVPEEEIVCVTPADFGFFEFGDKLINQIGFHTAIPGMDAVQRLVISHLRGAPQGRPFGLPAPGVSKRSWNPPVPGLK